MTDLERLLAKGVERVSRGLVDPVKIACTRCFELFEPCEILLPDGDYPGGTCAPCSGLPPDRRFFSRETAPEPSAAALAAQVRGLAAQVKELMAWVEDLDRRLITLEGNGE